MLEYLQDYFLRHWRDWLEVLILAVVFYYGYLSFRQTRGARIVLGLVGVLVGMAVMAGVLGLPVIGWLVRVLSGFLVIATLVIFQPELRRALADFGTHRFFSLRAQKAEFAERLDNVVRKLAAKRYGALFALERRIDLKQYAETGVALEAHFSDELVMTIFHPKTALHDGGVILRQDTLAAAACVFPVSQREMIDRSIGLRHRAGIGITEETDAIAVVVSEETGHVSICSRGEIFRNLDSEEFRAKLSELLLLEKKKEEADEHPARETRRSDGTATAKLER
jgi:diadenylate cyclase